MRVYIIWSGSAFGKISTVFDTEIKTGRGGTLNMRQHGLWPTDILFLLWLKKKKNVHMFINFQSIVFNPYDNARRLWFLAEK